MAEPITLGELERNDPKMAVRFVEQELDAGSFDPDDAQVLVRLQDDPEDYLALLHEMVERRRREEKPLGVFRIPGG